jgi:hypothetical protein
VLYAEAELRALLQQNEMAFFSSQSLSAFPEATLAYPSATRLCELANRADIDVAEAPIEPLYLRGPHITTPREQRVLFAAK